MLNITHYQRNATQNHNEVPISCRSEWLPSQSLQTINAGEGECCWCECKLVQPLWRTVWRFLKKLEIELPYDPAIPLLGIYTKETRTEKTHVPQWSLQHCLQQLGHRSNLDVHRQWIDKEVVVHIHNGMAYKKVPQKCIESWIHIMCLGYSKFFSIIEKKKAQKKYGNYRGPNQLTVTNFLKWHGNSIITWPIYMNEWWFH